MVYINSSGPREMFTGAYAKRMEQNKQKAMAERYQTEQKRTSFRDIAGEGVTVTISEESKEFMAGVAERKAAQLAARAEAAQELPDNAFVGTGDLKQQYLVFSENLYNNGFYDSMSDEDVKRMEDMLKSITSGMDSINEGCLSRNRETEMSHEAARLDLISSVNALQYFAEKYVPEEMRGSFHALIEQYEKYNSNNVSAHKSIYDLRDKSMKRIAPPNAANVNSAVKKTQEETLASMEIGRVTHTEEEEEKNKAVYQSLFEQLTNHTEQADSIFNSIKSTMIQYASGGSKNENVLALLNRRNSNSIQDMYSYWSKLLES